MPLSGGGQRKKDRKITLLSLYLLNLYDCTMYENPGGRHAGLPGIERADSLAKTGATLSVTHVPCPWLRLLQRLDTLATL